MYNQQHIHDHGSSEFVYKSLTLDKTIIITRSSRIMQTKTDQKHFSVKLGTESSNRNNKALTSKTTHKFFFAIEVPKHT